MARTFPPKVSLAIDGPAVVMRVTRVDRWSAKHGPSVTVEGMQRDRTIVAVTMDEPTWDRQVSRPAVNLTDATVVGVVVSIYRIAGGGKNGYVNVDLGIRGDGTPFPGGLPLAAYDATAPAAKAATPAPAPTKASAGAARPSVEDAAAKWADVVARARACYAASLSIMGDADPRATAAFASTLFINTDRDAVGQSGAVAAGKALGDRPLAPAPAPVAAVEPPPVRTFPPMRAASPARPGDEFEDFPPAGPEEGDDDLPF
jgi:hypothetical protein